MASALLVGISQSYKVSEINLASYCSALQASMLPIAVYSLISNHTHMGMNIA